MTDINDLKLKDEVYVCTSAGITKFIVSSMKFLDGEDGFLDLTKTKVIAVVADSAPNIVNSIGLDYCLWARTREELLEKLK